MDLTRYYTFGDLWQQVFAQYGYAAAERVAAAAETGSLTAVNATLSDIRRGVTPASYPGADDTSTAGLFWQQITTDPFAAPLDSANNQIGNVFKNIFRNPFVLLALVGVVFYLVGGFDWIKRKVANA